MKTINKEMKGFLEGNGVNVKSVKYIESGTMAGAFYLWGGKNLKWSECLANKLNELGFKDFDRNELDKFSGNGGYFSVFVIRNNSN